MTDTSRESNLVELHAKTDVDLASVIHGELALGAALTSAKDFDTADRASAEQAYENATKYLTKLDDPAEVAALDTKAKGVLRQAIDERVPNERT
jgi:hypothetical protein